MCYFPCFWRIYRVLEFLCYQFNIFPLFSKQTIRIFVYPLILWGQIAKKGLFCSTYKKWTKSVNLFHRYERLKTASLRTALRPAIYSNSAWQRNLSSPFFKHSYLLNKLTDFVHFLYAYVNFDADSVFAIFKVVSLFVCPTNSNYHSYLLPW